MEGRAAETLSRRLQQAVAQVGDGRRGQEGEGSPAEPPPLPQPQPHPPASYHPPGTTSAVWASRRQLTRLSGGRRPLLGGGGARRGGGVKRHRLGRRAAAAPGNPACSTLDGAGRQGGCTVIKETGPAAPTCAAPRKTGSRRPAPATGQGRGCSVSTHHQWQRDEIMGFPARAGGRGVPSAHWGACQRAAASLRLQSRCAAQALTSAYCCGPKVPGCGDGDGRGGGGRGGGG
jgi:hypothetical protein